VREGAPTLRPYQAGATAATVAARLAGQNRLLVQKPTGTGKTVWFASLLDHLAELRLAKGRGAVMLVIAHREELLDQAADKITRAHHGAMVAIEQGDRHASRYSDVVVASIQTLAAMKFRRLKKLIAQHMFRLVIVDEAHHAASKTYRTALALLGFLPMAEAAIGSDSIEAATHDDVVEMEKVLAGWDAQASQEQLLIGVTATPNRSDAVGLGCVFQTIAFSYPLRQAIEDKWLAPIVPWAIESTVQLDTVKNVGADFNQKQLAAAVNTEVRNKLAVAGWRDYAEGLSTIVFCVDVEHTHQMAAEFRSNGIPTEAITGDTPKEERRQILRRYSQGTVEVLCNCMVLTEGTDLPRTGCILHARPTQSALLYEQMTGRGLRLFPGKDHCIVLDVVDVSRRHSLMAAPVLYGLPPGLLANGKKLDDVRRDIDELRERYPGFIIDEAARLTLEQLHATAKTFDVWSVPSTAALGKGRAMDWMRVAADEYRLQYPWGDGTEIVTIRKDILGHFDVSLTLRPRDGSPARQRTIAAGVTNVQSAAGLAEAFILQERRSVMKLKATETHWHDDPPTEKQIAILRRIGAPIHRGLTKGDASRMISLHQARRSR